MRSWPCSASRTGSRAPVSPTTSVCPDSVLTTNTFTLSSMPAENSCVAGSSKAGQPPLLFAERSGLVAHHVEYDPAALHIHDRAHATVDVLAKEREPRRSFELAGCDRHVVRARRLAFQLGDDRAPVRRRKSGPVHLQPRPAAGAMGEDIAVIR